MISATTINEVFALFLTGATASEMFFKHLSCKDERNELKQFVYLILLERPQKTIDAWNAGYFYFYLSRIITNQLKSSSSPWHNQYRKNKCENIDEMELDIELEEFEIDMPNLRIEIASIISAELKKNPHLLKEFIHFQMRFVDGMTYVAIAKKTNISISCCKNYAKTARLIIKKQLELKRFN